MRNEEVEVVKERKNMSFAGVKLHDDILIKWEKWGILISEKDFN